MNAPATVTVTLDPHTLLIAAATAAATCEEVLNGNADVPAALKRKSAETFARTAGAIITAVSEAIAADVHATEGGETWSGPHADRPWRQASESERGESLAALAQNSPNAVALIRELHEAGHGN